MSQLITKTNTKRCNRCKVTLPYTDFKIKRNGEYYKQCNFCNIRLKSYRDNSKCIHKKCKTTCIECRGGSICEHNKVRSKCTECGGGSICKHNKVRSICKECDGGSICIHNILRARCRECGGGSYCEHDKRKDTCIICSNSTCEHNNFRERCKYCSPDKYIVNLCRSSVYKCIHKTGDLIKEHKTIKYIGCTEQELVDHLLAQITPEIEEVGFHIDHIKPVSKFDLSNKEELLKCCNWKNLQLLTPEENLKKSNRWTSEDEIEWNKNFITI